MRTQTYQTKLRTIPPFALSEQLPPLPTLDDAYLPSTVGLSRDEHSLWPQSTTSSEPNTPTPSSSASTSSEQPIAGLKRFLRAIPKSYRDDSASIALVTQLHTAVKSKDTNVAWDTYQHVLHNHPLGSRLIPPRLLHSLISRIWKSRPITRQTFLRLLSITSELRGTGDKVYQWEWNALIHAAAAGLRKPTVEDFETSLGMVQELMADTITKGPSHSETRESRRIDIGTLNTLLSIASRMGSNKAFHRALGMMKDQPHLSADKITCLILLNHNVKNGQLESIPWCISRLLEIGEEIDIRAVNATMWGYGRAGRLDFAMSMYRRLRLTAAHFGADPSTTKASYCEFGEDLEPHPILSIPGVDQHLGKLVPDRITYTALIQCLAYFGDFTNAISVFRDLLGTKRCRHDSRFMFSNQAPSSDESAITFTPSVEIYRALFLGFTRFGVGSSSPSPLPPSLFTSKWRPHPTTARLHPKHQLPSSSPLPLHHPAPEKLEFVSPESHSSWTISSLELIFENFLQLPLSNSSSVSTSSLSSKHFGQHRIQSSSSSFALSQPISHQGSPPPLPETIIYWALVAFSRTTGGDKAIMRDVWYQMACAFDLAHPRRPLLSSEPPTHDGRYRVRGRLKRLVDWLESEG